LIYMCVCIYIYIHSRRRSKLIQDKAMAHQTSRLSQIMRVALLGLKLDFPSTVMDTGHVKSDS
jgi:hypothetical protein